MKFERVLIFALTITSAAARHVLQPRQETGISTTLTTTPDPTNQGQTTGTTPRPIASSGASSDGSAATTDNASKRSSTSEAAVETTVTTTRGIAIQTPASNTTSSGDPKPLPIPPKITPGVGFAGTILMITGLCYGMIGIKNKMLYRFFGVAYLSALAVTVLIIYCMNPPVSDGIQAGFVVAAIFAGILSGACSLLFPDMIEGFGCMLGGYCLSMWFLCLKDGGLIQQRTGKIIFIACMSVAAFSLSFSHYTRTYGLIVCIPFSGATAAIIGVDCFSRAGLKEMWIYVWQINDDVFPLHTTTYPITRGIRVETAGVILLFLLGLITHVRLSKIIKQRRDQKQSSKARQEEEMEREEEAVGRRVEANIGQERVRWESVYGGGKQASVTTAVGSTESMTKTSDKRLSSTRDMEMSQISLARDKQYSKDPKESAVTITGADTDGDEIQRIGQQRHSGLSKDGPNSKRSTQLSIEPSTGARPASAFSNQSLSDRSASHSPAPEVVPLPFRIPGVEMKVPKSDIGSLSAIEESFMNRRVSQRALSMSSTWKRTSNSNPLREVSASAEDLIIPRDDDRASSLAATLDELDDDDMSLSEVSLPHSPLARNFDSSSPMPSHRSSSVPSPLVEARTINLDGGSIIPSDTVEDLVSIGPAPDIPEKSMKRTSFSNDTRDAALALDSKEPASREAQGLDAPPTHPKPSDSPDDAKRILTTATSSAANADGKEKSAEVKGKRESVNAERRRSGLSQTRRERRESLKSASAGPSDQSHAGTMGSLMEHLPDQMSKVVLQYRTNEWAKHLSVAEEPARESIEQPPSPGIKVDTTFNDASQEHTPISPVVDPDQFIQPMLASKNRGSGLTAAQDRPRTASGLQSKRSSLNAVQPRPQSGSLTPNNLSTPQLTRPSSSSNLQTYSPRASRNMSTPQLLRTSTEPIGARSERPRPERMGTLKQIGSATAPVPSETLLGKRESLVKNKPTSMSFAQSSRPNLMTTPPIEAGSRRAADSDEVPLAIHRHSLRAQQKREDSWPPHSAFQQPALNQSTLTLGAFDSHQPQRETSKISQSKREFMLTSWRQSLRAEQQQAQMAGPSSSQTADEARRLRMINEKRQREMIEKQEKIKKSVRDDQFDQAMRNGTMIDAHRKALQRMQSDAK